MACAVGPGSDGGRGDDVRKHQRGNEPSTKADIGGLLDRHQNECDTRALVGKPGEDGGNDVASQRRADA
jgi:hypothetical protein